MIKRYLALALLMVSVSGIAAKVVPTYLAARQLAASTDGGGEAAARPAPAAGMRQVAVDADRRGHFFVEALVDGRLITFMVDTGATSVALTEATARRLNIRPTTADYNKVRTSTANGVVGAAPVMLRRIKVGSISVSNVQALVLPGEVLQTNLLGMSFLRKLRRFEAQGSQLLLVQ